jgi:hypothetical protein
MSTDNLPKCPACQEDMTYPDGNNYVCAQCGHEWPIATAVEEEVGLIVKDANGNPTTEEKPAGQVAAAPAVEKTTIDVEAKTKS